MPPIIRNPVAYAAAVARNAMLDQQSQNLQSYEQNGVTGAVNQQLVSTMIKQSTRPAEPASKYTRPIGAYIDVFKGGTSVPGFGEINRSAYKVLNLGEQEK